MKPGILASAALSLAALGLAGCGSDGAQQQTETAPEGFPGITVTNGRLVLPTVKGNPGAVYFDISYDGDDVAVLRAADVAGAKSAMLHETVEANGQSSMQESMPIKINKGATIKFEPGGRHVMAMDLDDTLQPGGTTEVTLTFTGGDKMSFPAQILAPGDAH